MTGTTIASLKVAKKFGPLQKGALKLSRRYGSALVCVRHRHDTRTGHRYTTVELVVDSAPIQGWDERIASVRIGYHEESVRAQARAPGARWDPAGRVWRMTLGTVRKLGLEARVVEAGEAGGGRKER